jgi:hypothetical protein
VFFDCYWFDPNHGTQENQFDMVEVKHTHKLCGCDSFILAHQVKQVYYMSYPCEKLSAWWVVYRVNPHERLHTPDDSGYHKNQVAAGEVNEVYPDYELSCLFNIHPDSTLNSLLGDANDVTVPEERKQALRKKKHKILNVLYISYYVFYISYYILAISYYVLYISHNVFDEYSLVLVLNRMLKKLMSRRSSSEERLGQRRRTTFFRVIVLPLAGEQRS